MRTIAIQKREERAKLNLLESEVQEKVLEMIPERGGKKEMDEFCQKVLDYLLSLLPKPCSDIVLAPNGKVELHFTVPYLEAWDMDD